MHLEHSQPVLLGPATPPASPTFLPMLLLSCRIHSFFTQRTAMGKQKQVNTNQLRAGLTKAYRLVQFARLCAGDVTVIAECLIEAGIEHEAATYVAEVMGVSALAQLHAGRRGGWEGCARVLGAVGLGSADQTWHSKHALEGCSRLG